jgi:hypothetical protein
MRSMSTIPVVVLLALAGCVSEQASKARLPGEDKVLAEVNGTTITQWDVNRVAKDMFGERSKEFDAETKRKLLESLVNSRAIAQAREKELSPLELAEIDAKAKAYREEMLVQQYLSKHARNEGVKPDLARRYYDENTARFGGGTVRNYELVTAPSAGSDARQRTGTLAALADAGAQRDWTAWAQKLNAQGIAVTVRRGQDDDSMLQPKVRQLIAQTKVSEASKPTIIDGVPYVVRVSSETVKPPKPFAEVESEIAKALAPEQIKDAVRQVSTSVLKNAEVAYR